MLPVKLKRLHLHKWRKYPVRVLLKQKRSPPLFWVFCLALAFCVWWCFVGVGRSFLPLSGTFRIGSWSNLSSRFWIDLRHKEWQSRTILNPSSAWWLRNKISWKENRLFQTFKTSTFRMSMRGPTSRRMRIPWRIAVIWCTHSDSSSQLQTTLWSRQSTLPIRVYVRLK